MPALAAVARPNANAALNTIDLTIICSFPDVDGRRNRCGRRASKATAAMNGG
jgi:hypothetical protein